MLLGLFADIHANRQAFATCLADARQKGAERVVLLGDYVGYGADPEWTVAQVIELVAGGQRSGRPSRTAALQAFVATKPIVQP
mgnify:CR=1 FL=1